MGAERSRLRQEHPGIRIARRSIHRHHSNIDTAGSNPMSRFLLHILAAFAELERELIRERVTAGVRVAKARGKQVGRPKRIFRRDEAVRLRAEGKSWRTIAHLLDVPVATLIDACKPPR